jgi:hypothetical protein
MVKEIEYVKFEETKNLNISSAENISPQLKYLLGFAIWQTTCLCFIAFTLFLVCYSYLNDINLIEPAKQTLFGAVASFVIMVIVYQKLLKFNQKV